MKKNLLTLLLLIAGSLSLQAQSYVGLLADPSQQWHVGSVCNWGNGCLTNDNYTYFINGDTTVASQTYSKVYREGSFYEIAMGPGFLCDQTGYYLLGPLLIREAGQQVYQYDQANMQEIHLYDFTLQVGDTVPNTANEVTVESIDSIMVNGAYRTRWNLQGGFASSFIEGIGSLTGLFEPIGTIFECAYTLQTVCESNSIVWPTAQSGSSCPAIPTGIRAYDNSLNLSVWPQPSSGKLNIQGSFTSDNVELAVHSQQGQLVWNGQMMATANQPLSLDLSELAAGTYFLNAKQSGRSWSSLVLVMP